MRTGAAIEVPGRAVLVLVAIAACSGDLGRAAPDGVSLRDSAGVLIVRNHSLPPSDSCITVETDPALRIGSGTAVGTAAPPLYEVQGGAVLTDGGIVLLNAGNRDLLYYDPGGRFRFRAGGAGRGPGEFIRPTWMGHLGGDTLLVWDGTLSRLSIFDGDGAFITSQNVRFRGSDHASPELRGRFSDGSFLVDPGSLIYLTGSETGVTRLAQSYQRYDPASGRTTPIAEGRSMELVVSDAGAFSLPFGKSEMTVAHGDRLLVADNGVPIVFFLDLNGRLRRVMSWVSESIAVTAADRAAYFRTLVNASSHAPPADIPFAAERPRFASIHSGRDGTIWVHGYAPGWEPPAPWLVFDGNGVFKCDVRMPARVAALEIGGAYLLGLETDSLGEESVLLFGLRRSETRASPGQ